MCTEQIVPDKHVICACFRRIVDFEQDNNSKNIEHMHYLIKLPIARGLRSQARSIGARTNNKNEEIAPILEIPKYESP